MVEKVSSDPAENRATRRQRARSDALGRERYTWSSELSKTANGLDATARQWNEIITEKGHNITAVVYRGDPFVYGFLDVRRGLIPLLDKAFEVNSRNPFCSPEFLRRFEAHDIYQFKLGGGILSEGVSLLDIEKMSIDGQEERELDLGDIVRINRMLRLNFALRPLFRFQRPWSESREEKLVRQAILYSVCQKVSRPELKITVPKTVQPLYERLISYCDFYTGLLTDYSLSEYEDLSLLKTLSLSRPWLTQMLGCYIPGRLGISPSSAIKLFHERVENSSAHPLYWRKILETLALTAGDAFRYNQLPTEIEPYQYYGQIDQKEEEKLFSRFLLEDLTGNQQVLAHLSSGQLMARLTLYHKIIRHEINLSPNKKIEVSVDDGVFDNMMLVCQYPNTLMFLVRFREDQKQVLLEIGKNVRGDKFILYGLPPKLSAQNPQLADRVLSQMLPPLIDKMISTHPEVENGYKIRPFIPVVIPSIKGQGLKEDEVVLSPELKPKEPKQKKTVLTPLQRFLGETIPPNPQSSQRKFIVLVSKSKIEESMPKNTPSSVIDQILHEIRNLETGRTTFADKIQRSDVWEIKSRRYRIFLRHQQGEIYTFVAAGKRSLEERLFRRVK